MLTIFNNWIWVNLC